MSDSYDVEYVNKEKDLLAQHKKFLIIWRIGDDNGIWYYD